MPETVECIHDTEGGEECIQAHYINNIRTAQCKRCKKCGLFIPAHIMTMIAEVFHKRPAPLPNLVTVTNEPVDPNAKRCIHCSIIEPRHATYCKLYQGPQADAGGNLGATAMSKNIPLVTVNHLLMLLQDARSGQSEMLMKEVWEDCSKEEVQLADNELALMMRYLEDRKHALRPRTEEPKIYPWKDPDGVVMGRITVSVDKNLLPILAIDVEDDHFSGIVEHKDLFRIITQIAELTSKKGS